MMRARYFPFSFPEHGTINMAQELGTSHFHFLKFHETMKSKQCPHSIHSLTTSPTDFLQFLLADAQAVQENENLIYLS